MSDRTALIEERLRSELTPDAGAKDGGHFTVRIVSAAFTGKTLIQRHRLIHAALADLMHREIHALSISKAKTPDEA